MAGLSEFYQVLAGASHFLSEAECKTLDEATYKCLANYAWLAHWHMCRGNCRYNIVHKHHVMMHIPQMARFSVNPRLVSTYMEESFIGQGWHTEASPQGSRRTMPLCPVFRTLPRPPGGRGDWSKIKSVPKYDGCKCPRSGTGSELNLGGAPSPHKCIYRPQSKDRRCQCRPKGSRS